MPSGPNTAGLLKKGLLGEKDMGRHADLALSYYELRENQRITLSARFSKAEVLLV